MQYSELESKRFNMKIHRASVEEVEPSKIKQSVLGENSDILILRVPSTSKGNHSLLQKTGFPFIHADTLVYYECDFEKYNPNGLKNNLTFEQIDSSNKTFLEHIVPDIFVGYQNHYFSNPLLDKSDIMKGYIEWSQGYCTSDEGKISWYVKKNENIIGFATCSFDVSTRICEGVLYGVLSEHSGGGVYSDIIRFTQSYFLKNGYRKMLVSTQVQNFAVQKVWTREGFFIKQSYDTYHVLAMLNFSTDFTRISNFSISEEEVDKFADFSGDYNPIHFDNQYAIQSGFKSKITHGMIFQSYLSKYFGTEYPGHGSIFIGNNNIFLQPLYVDETYKLSVTPFEIRPNGLHRIVAIVRDANNQICSVSYNELLKK